MLHELLFVCIAVVPFVPRSLWFLLIESNCSFFVFQFLIKLLLQFAFNIKINDTQGFLHKGTLSNCQTLVFGVKPDLTEINNFIISCCRMSAATTHRFNNQRFHGNQISKCWSNENFIQRFSTFFHCPQVKFIMKQPTSQPADVGGHVHFCPIFWYHLTQSLLFSLDLMELKKISNYMHASIRTDNEDVDVNGDGI